MARRKLQPQYTREQIERLIFCKFPINIPVAIAHGIASEVFEELTRLSIIEVRTATPKS